MALLLAAVATLLALAERYPELRADRQFLDLQRQLAGLELDGGELLTQLDVPNDLRSPGDTDHLATIAGSRTRPLWPPMASHPAALYNGLVIWSFADGRLAQMVRVPA